MKLVHVGGHGLVLVAIAAAQACGSGQDNNVLLVCPDVGTVVSDATEVPWARWM